MSEDYLVRINHGSKPGDGFSGEIFCIEIVDKNNDKKLDLVCKVAPFNENHRKEFHSKLVFNRESLLYTKFLPLFAKFQKEKNVPETDQFLSYPKCYTTLVNDDHEQYAVILDDLRPHDFKMWDKTKPSPIGNVRLVLRELGKFHGLSMALKDQRPEQFYEFKKVGCTFRDFFLTETVQAMYRSCFDRALKSLRSEHHRNIMQHIKANFVAYVNDCFEIKAAERFAVLCHGDCWNNNILYRFNRHDVAEEIRFIDWQIISYTTPANDILYNIFTSTDKPLRDEEYENMLKCYHESLRRTVKLLGSDPNELFTFENLKLEMKRIGNYALIMAPYFLQLSLADSSDLTSLGEEFDKAADRKGTVQFLKSLSGKGQLEYDRRLNEVFEDIVSLGYYQEVN